jgi:hypothetical protein
MRGLIVDIHAIVSVPPQVIMKPERNRVSLSLCIIDLGFYNQVVGWLHRGNLIPLIDNHQLFPLYK